MMEQRIRFASSPDCHHEGVGHKLRRHFGLHRPADYAPREQVDDGRHIDPALRRPNIREVSDPFAVGSRGFEGAVEHVGCDSVRLTLPRIGRKAAPSRSRPESLQAHQSFNTVQSARHTLCKQVVPYLRGVRAYVATLKDGKIAGPGAEDMIKDIAEMTGIKDMTLLHQMVPVFIDTDGRVDTASIETDLAYFKSRGLVTSDVTTASVVDMSFVEALKPVLGPFARPK
jgi:hypothetical protein